MFLAMILYLLANEPVAESNHGLATEWVEAQKAAAVNGNEERIWFRGRPLSREEMAVLASEGMEGPEDDSDKPWIMFIGTEAERKAMVQDWNTHEKLRPFQSRFRQQAYPPDHWALAGVGFDATAKVVVQLADGFELHKQKDFNGPDSLAIVLAKAEGLRKPRSDYDPARTPDLRNSSGLRGVLGAVPMGVWAAGAALGILILLKRR